MYVGSPQIQKQNRPSELRGASRGAPRVWCSGQRPCAALPRPSSTKAAQRAQRALRSAHAARTRGSAATNTSAARRIWRLSHLGEERQGWHCILLRLPWRPPAPARADATSSRLPRGEGDRAHVGAGHVPPAGRASLPLPARRRPPVSLWCVPGPRAGRSPASWPCRRGCELVCHKHLLSAAKLQLQGATGRTSGWHPRSHSWLPWGILTAAATLSFTVDASSSAGPQDFFWPLRTTHPPQLTLSRCVASKQEAIALGCIDH